MTMLPSDYSRRPWKDKYIDEETPMFARWFVFGERPDGTVDICSGDNDIFENVPRDVAARILAARDKFCEAIIEEIGLSAAGKALPNRNRAGGSDEH
jgi:hypothetical protein